MELAKTETTERTAEDEARYLILGTLPTAQEEEEERGFKSASFVLTAIAFALLYAFMPNTKVRLKPTFMGGFIAAADCE